MKKFEFTGEIKVILDGKVLHRIRALIDIRVGRFLHVKAGDLGGWLEKEENLSQEDNAWVCGNAHVFNNARVYGNAYVCDDAWVYGNACVYGNAHVFDNACVYGNTYVCDDAWVYGNAHVFDNACVYGNTYVCDDAWVYGNAHVCDDAWVYGNAWICCDAIVKKSDHYLTVGPIGSRDDTTTFFRNAKGIIKVKCGCFLGTVDAFLEKVTKTHGNNKHAVVYRAAAALAVAQIDTTVTDDKPPKER